MLRYIPRFSIFSFGRLKEHNNIRPHFFGRLVRKKLQFYWNYTLANMNGILHIHQRCISWMEAYTARAHWSGSRGMKQTPSLWDVVRRRSDVWIRPPRKTSPQDYWFPFSSYRTFDRARQYQASLFRRSSSSFIGITPSTVWMEYSTFIRDVPLEWKQTLPDLSEADPWLQNRFPLFRAYLLDNSGSTVRFGNIFSQTRKGRNPHLDTFEGAGAWQGWGSGRAVWLSYNQPGYELINFRKVRRTGGGSKELCVLRKRTAQKWKCSLSTTKEQRERRDKE